MIKMYNTPINIGKYIRFGILSVDLVKEISNAPEFGLQYNGKRISCSSQRIQVFKAHNYCVVCGLTGEFFAIEAHKNGSNSTHLNLYGHNKKGQEVMLTKDHIIPKSLGGPNTVSNYQTMCYKCNQTKQNHQITLSQIASIREEEEGELW